MTMTNGCMKTIEQTRVLVVEDETRLRDVLLTSVSELGYPASGARSGEEASRMMTDDPRDIVVLDLHLPGMDGLEFFELIRQRWPKTQVIILTGLGDLEAAQHAVRLDVVDFLTKPASLGDLELALNRAWRRLNDSIRLDLLDDDSKGTAVPPDGVDAQASLRDLERKHILDVIERHRGNRTAAAAELGISVRTLYYRLAEYLMDVEEAPSDGAHQSGSDVG
jgi:DNA-binding NtrC family response regulator